MKAKRIIASVLVLVSCLTISCTRKERPETFVQGQGTNLLAISDFSQKSFVIKTKGELGTAAFSNAQSKSSKVSSDKFAMNALGPVNYESDSKHLRGVQIKGRANHSYKGLYVLTDHLLKIYKIAKRADTPFDEATYAEKLSADPDELAIPLLAYPIKAYYRVENVLNDKGQKTNKLTEMPVDSRAEATHFKVDWTSSETFEAVTKTNLFPREFFDGEWYYSETSVEAREGDKNDIGGNYAYDQNLSPSNRIKMILQEGSLKVVNLNIDDRLKGKNDGDNLNLEAAMTIPVEWQDFRVATRGSEKQMREQEDKTRHWSDRPYVRLRLSDARTLVSSPGIQRLVDLEATDDYFSFVLETEDSKKRLKYSMRRIRNAQSYLPRRYTREDARKFGFFASEKTSVTNFEKYRKEDFEKNVYINRFNPDVKTIVYHFTDSSPDWLRGLGRTAVAGWNQAFQAAGTGITIQLDESFDVKLGDIRYNSINLIDSLSESNLLGFGPSVTDPFTGEIIAATTNVHIASVRSALIAEIRRYITSKVGAYNDKYPISSLLARLNMKSGDFTGVVASGVIAPPPMSPAGKNYGREFDIGITSANIHREIEASCPRVLAYVGQVQGTASGDSPYVPKDNELDLLKACADKLLPGKAIGTLVHEMGHNFGLRHNFYGSVDQGNFSRDEHGHVTARSSSVMEYTSFNEDRLAKPGPYDIAAIRFGYLENADIQGSFMFCTDEDVDLFKNDPMCARHDSGVTPLEVVKSIIAQYNADFATRNYRLDRMRVDGDSDLEKWREMRFHVPLRRFYNQWRMILALYVGLENKYLTNVTRAQYEEVLARMKADPKFGPYYAQYKPAADLVFEFFARIALMPVRYCVGMNSSGNLDLIELEGLRDSVAEFAGKDIRGCSTPVVAEYLKNRYGLTLIAETGNYLHSMRFNTAAEKNGKEPLDVVGSAKERETAIAMLTGRPGVSVEGKSFLTPWEEKNDFQPGFLDEPQYRERCSALVTKRITQGLDTGFVKENLKLLQAENPQLAKIDLDRALAPRLLKFGIEKDILKKLVTDLRKSTIVPGQGHVTSERDLEFMSYGTLNQDYIAKAVAKIELSDRTYIVLSPRATTKIEMFNRYSALANLARAAQDLRSDSGSALPEGITVEQVREYERNRADLETQRDLLYELITSGSSPL